MRDIHKMRTRGQQTVTGTTGLVKVPPPTPDTSLPGSVRLPFSHNPRLSRLQESKLTETTHPPTRPILTHRNKKSAMAHPAPDYSSSSWPPSSSTTTATPPPPWVKELPPVRDGRRQFATGVIIPFLDQHLYPPGGVAEVRRARRREKEAFLKKVFVTTGNVNNASVNPVAARKNAGGVSNDIRGPAEGRQQPICAPPGRQKAGQELGHRSGGPVGGVAGKHEQATRGLPRGNGLGGNGKAVVASQRRELGPGNRSKSGCGGGSCTAGGVRAAVVDDTDGDGAAGGADGAACARIVTFGEDIIASDVDAAGAQNSSLPAKVISATKEKEEEPLLASAAGENVGGISTGNVAVSAVTGEGPNRAQHEDGHAAGGASGKRGRDDCREEATFGGRNNSETATATTAEAAAAAAGATAAESENNAHSPKAIQRRGQRGEALGEHGGTGGRAAALEFNEKAERVANPTPVVTSSVSVLDMGIMRSSE